MNERKKSLANRHKRDVLSMVERELKVAAALDGRLKNADNLTVDQLRERVLKWMFSKNLSMKHEFVFEEMGDELYILMGKTCKCCEDAPPAERVRYTSQTSSSGLDGEANIEVFPAFPAKRSPSIPTVFVPKSMMRSSGRQKKVSPITEEPRPQDPVGMTNFLIINNPQRNSPSSTAPKKDGQAPAQNGKKEKSACCCCQLYRECVLSFMNMC
ncbi:hypothetical protein PMAYCL1PPCAC_13686 [Pristionchus mayeri]|uniref:Uncharacterized protein n=1 Tax=Pristionchus mayeri TaxID=1317129 RepID=A0AAN5CHC2_9BILA|nr:hypothetical protein PMAYCL1PPCAC_13686 [Pristionchus mayeri]